MTKMQKRLMSIVVVLAALAAGTGIGLVAARSASDEDGVAGDGRGPKVAAVTSICKKAASIATVTDEDSASSSSTSFVDVPEMTVTLSTKSPCVVIDFSAFSYAPGGELSNVSALMDGVTAGSPAEVQFATDSSSWSEAHAYNFAFSGVPKGVHTFKVQFRSVVGGFVGMSKPAMVVHYG